MAESTGSFLDGVDGKEILRSGTSIVSSLLKPNSPAPAPRPAAPAPAPTKTNFMPWIIGGVALVLVVGGLIVAGVFMRPKGTP